MKRIFLLAFLPVLVVGFISCTVLKIQRPPETYQNAIANPPASYLSIPFELDLKKMERLINQQFKGLIYADTSFDNNDHDNLMVKAWKMSDIHLTMDGNQVSYTVPLSVWIKKKFVIGAFGIGVSDTREVTGNVILKFRTRLAVQKDWTISAFTISDGYDWVTTPVLQLGGGVTIPLPFISDILLEANQKDINTQIDKAFQSSFDLKSYIAPVWKSIQEPIRIPGDYPLWLKIIPLGLSTVPLQGSSDLVRHTVGIKAYTELFYGDEPSFTVNDTIPDLKITSRLDDDFNISLGAGVPFPLINGIASEKLKGYQFSHGKYHFEVKDIQLYGNGPNLIVALNIAGSVKGAIYLSGKPYFDKETSTIKVKDLDFDIRTRNVLVKSASWILHHEMVQGLGKQLSFPLGDQLDAARKELQSFLDSNKKVQYFSISGTIDKPEIGDILITQKTVKVMIIFKGKLRIGVEVE